MDIFTEERQKKILEVINEKERISVSELSQLFNISEVTIRRDLKTLHNRNLIERTHGGAMKLPTVLHGLIWHGGAVKYTDSDKNLIGAGGAKKVLLPAQVAKFRKQVNYNIETKKNMNGKEIGIVHNVSINNMKDDQIKKIVEKEHSSKESRKIEVYKKEIDKLHKELIRSKKEIENKTDIIQQLQSNRKQMEKEF